ncbi:MAG: octaprenyl diphosphate synthase [Gammaproteobacteria bacterium]|nr:octaprenyl diphosphate synthase [Gammaproteobacteria bacterium]
MRMTILSANKLLSSELMDLDRELKARSQTKVEMINTLSEHIISSGGKRLRPIVLMLSAYASNPDIKNNLIDPSVIVEFIHAATLLHDDVVDMSKMRHSQDTANMIWGNKGAVLVGDFLYSRAFEIIVEINNPLVYQTLANTTNTIAQGEVIQLMNIGNIDLDENAYMDIIYRKTAILFEASAKIGGILSNKDHLEALGSFGLHFGIAYQLRNDYLDYFGDSGSTGKNAIEDLYEGKATLPVIHSLSNANGEDESFLRNAYKDTSNIDGQVIIKILKKYKSNQYIQERIQNETDLAISSLKELKSSRYKEELIGLAEFCATRVS